MSDELTREQVEIAVMQASNTGSIEPLKRILETDAALRAKVEALQTCIEDRDRDIIKQAQAALRGEPGGG